MPFCLPKHVVEKFKQDLKSGKFDFNDLFEMTSSARNKKFNAYFGEDVGTEVNALFERKLMLKYQKKGMIDWIKTVAGMKDETRRDIVSRINRMEDILEPKGNFLADLAAQKLGITVTQEEAATISQMAKEVNGAREKMEGNRRREGSEKWTKAEEDYGIKAVAFKRYLEVLEEDPRSLSKQALRYLNPLNVIKDIAGSAKAIVASWDNSFIGRQGIKLFYHGITGKKSAMKTWLKTFFYSFKAIVDTFRGKPVMDTLQAQIISDPDYDLMRKAGVATATAEEEFPTSWPSKIPVIGKIFEASENAFTFSAYYMRYKSAKALFEVARASGIDMGNEAELKNMGKFINSLTSRGDLGLKSDKPGFVNAVMWSPRMIKANLDVLLLHPLGVSFNKKDVDTKYKTTFAQRQAAESLVRVVVGQAMVLGIAQALLGDDTVEWDPQSSNFGKIRVGNTRFDISGGMAAFIVLAARILPALVPGPWEPRYKSSTTGVQRSLWQKGFGRRDASEVVIDFFLNKTAPFATVIRDQLRNETFDRETPSWRTRIKSLGIPITVQTVPELLEDPESAPFLASMIAEVLGFGASTYEHVSTWSSSKLKDEIKKSTYKRTTSYRDKATGKKVKRKKGAPHKGKEQYVEILQKELNRGKR